MARLFRWPWRRRSHSAPGLALAARSTAAPTHEPHPERGPEIDVDLGFAQDFRSRAEARDATPALGPWAGLADTARFAVAASRFESTLVTRRFTDDLVAHEPRLGASPAGFISSLDSLASYRTPSGAPDESGSPFRDSLPVSRGELFAPAPAAPVAAAFLPRSAATQARSAGTATISRAAALSASRPTPGSTARPAPPRASASTSAQRTVDAPRSAQRPRSLVTESTSLDDLPTPGAAGASVGAAPPLHAEPGRALPSLAPPEAPLALAEAKQGAPAATAATTASASPPPSPPRSPTEIARATDLLIAGSPSPDDELPPLVPVAGTVARAVASAVTPSEPPIPAPPGPVDALEQPVSAQETLEDTLPLGHLAPPVLARSVDEQSGLPLPLVTDSGRLGPEEAPPSPGAPSHSSDVLRQIERAANPATGTPARLVPSETPPPIPIEASAAEAIAAGTAAQAGLSAPVQPIRRFTVGEPVARGLPLPQASRTSSEAQGVATGEGPPVARGTTPATPAAVPIARATLVGLAPRGAGPASPTAPPASPADVTPAADRQAPLGPLQRSVPGGELPLAIPAPGGSADDVDASASGVPASSPAPEAGAISRAPAGFAAESAEPSLLFRTPAEAPFPMERSPVDEATPGVPPRVDRPAGLSAGSTLTDLPLAPSSAPAAAEATAGWRATALPVVQRMAGSADATAPSRTMVWRAPEGGAGEESPAPPSAPAGAVGQMVPAEPPKAPEQDIDKLTEKVWQRIRRTLQLERERHRGLP